MLIPVAFNSVNSPESLAPGRYLVTCDCYGRGDEPLTVLLFRYTPASGGPSAAVDLLIKERDGTLRARDFLWMPDRSWRDSDGTRSNRLDALLPEEILGLQFVGRRVLEELTLGEES